MAPKRYRQRPRPSLPVRVVVDCEGKQETAVEDLIHETFQYSIMLIMLMEVNSSSNS